MYGLVYRLVYGLASRHECRRVPVTVPAAMHGVTDTIIYAPLHVALRHVSCSAHAIAHVGILIILQMLFGAMWLAGMLGSE